ncbi:uncharacterized protein DUF1918 [Krasilnikovia cinnamomea]|uniref:Uncharacterized protein DUF1918 n=1 Tax=Krasilnikovia cinnamomea TaxID=349313 RepID=A0A4Q7ZSP7_9ACTN|nr:DUF1918 domain-containing protein [Krasilnikovia cinnamomea]RZU53535.1 uncharacterized protein DUF1918 [Krasilnikovia cinnamomea]
MIARVGDRLVLKGVHLGDLPHVGVITAVRHADGSPPYEVRWLDDGRYALVFPGPEAHVEPAQHGNVGHR